MVNPSGSIVPLNVIFTFWLGSATTVKCCINYTRREESFSQFVKRHNQKYRSKNDGRFLESKFGTNAVSWTSTERKICIWMSLNLLLGLFCCNAVNEFISKFQVAEINE